MICKVKIKLSSKSLQCVHVWFILFKLGSFTVFFNIAYFDFNIQGTILHEDEEANMQIVYGSMYLLVVLSREHVGLHIEHISCMEKHNNANISSLLWC